MRRDAKLEKLAVDDPKRFELQAQFISEAWLDDAARRAAQIQAVTHSLKPMHPDAKGTSLFCEPSSLPQLQEIGSHNLVASFDTDVVGNAAALDVYKFLKLTHQGQTFLEMALDGDVDFGKALTNDAALAASWMAAFASVARPRGKPRSHTLAKQIYWLVSDDPHADQSYHLLAPLYPTSLVHQLYLTLQSDRFSEEAKAAREARKAGAPHDCAVREYPNLAIQKLGGTKPQNISQLNSERRGDNCLLASLPPVWQSFSVRPLLHSDSLFKRFGSHQGVRGLVRQLRHLLKLSAATMPIRQHRDELVDAIIDELLQFTALYGELSPGWSRADDCRLPRAHRKWLDPEGADGPVQDVSDEVADDFARWLNVQLSSPLPVGDPEFLHWRKRARDVLKHETREVAHVN